MTDVLPSWRDGATRQAILDFVAAVTEGPDAVPEAERVAVFDNDGTLWTEKPMPTQLHYLLLHWAAAAKADPSLAEKQPYKAAATGDLAWLGDGGRQALRRRRQRPEGDDRRDHRRDRRTRASRTTTPRCPPSTATRSTSPCTGRTRRDLPADGRAAALPRGARLHLLHRLRRRPRLHAPDDRRLLRDPAGARDRLGVRARVRRGDATTSATGPASPSWTTARRSRSGSGAGSAAGRCWPAATRTATSRCCGSCRSTRAA